MTVRHFSAEAKFFVLNAKDGKVVFSSEVQVDADSYASDSSTSTGNEYIVVEKRSQVKQQRSAIITRF